MVDFILSIDNAVADAMIGLQNGFLTPIMYVVTLLSDKGLIWIALGIFLLAYKKTRKFGVIYALSLLTAFVLSEYTVKLIVCRQRPFIAQESIKLLISAPSGYSFPSSHSCSSFGSAVSIFLQNKRYGAFALAFAVLVAFSRLYFTVHYLSDILAGALLGSLAAIIIFAVFRLIKNRKPQNKSTN